MSKYNCEKNLDGKNHYHPRILTTIQKVGSSRISLSLFLLIRFWILDRNDIFCFPSLEILKLQKCKTSELWVTTRLEATDTTRSVIKVFVYNTFLLQVIVVIDVGTSCQLLFYDDFACARLKTTTIQPSLFSNSPL